MRYKLLVGLMVCTLVMSGASAYISQIEFQDNGTPGYYGISCDYYDSNVSWQRSGDGGNSQLNIQMHGYTLSQECYHSNGNPTTYAAATLIGSYHSTFRLFDTTKTQLYNYPVAYTNGRFEMQMSGMQANIYRNGTLIATSDVLAQNPSYVGFGAYDNGNDGWAYWDDFVFSSDAPRSVVGVPEQGLYKIMNDWVNPDATGFYYTANDTLITSNVFTTSWSTTGINGEAALNQSIELREIATGTVYQTQYTDSGLYGTTTWNISAFLEADPPYGLYQVHFNETLSEPILYSATGATVSWDADTYSTGETAAISYNINDDYFDLSTYTYKIAIYDGLTGTRILNDAVPAKTGNATYTFTESDTIGIYYAVIVATANVGGAEYWFAADIAEHSPYLSFYGYVNDGANETVISGANVVISQYANSVTSISVTGDDGFYSTFGYPLQSGLATIFNVTADGYDQYYVALITAQPRQTYLNFTLSASTPASYAGLAIGGIAREGIFDSDDLSLTYGYGRPIDQATVYVYNTTTAETYTTTTNTFGWYLCDNNALCYLVNARPYIVQGNKTGFNVSPTYPVTVTGVF